MIDDDHNLEPDMAFEQRSPARARAMLRKLDRTLDRLRRQKGAGWARRLMTGALALFVIAPIFLVAAYRFIDAPSTILMVQRRLEGRSITHAPVKLADISPHLVRAVIAAEDAKFCRHHGFDMDAINAAMAADKAESGRGKGTLRGGSTISQQTAKNLFLWPHRDWLRKGAEAYFTVLTERLWPKKRILEQYLNVVEWGDGKFGAEAAARAYFGKAAKDLTAGEAARLAAVLPSPNKWSVDHPGPYVRARASSIEARMWVLRDQRLDNCVLDARAAAPPKPTGHLPAELPPLPEPPPAIIDEDQPIAQAAPAPDSADMSDAHDANSEPAPAEPIPPADAPLNGKHAPSGALPGAPSGAPNDQADRPTGAGSAPSGHAPNGPAPDAPGPLNIAP